MSGGTSKRRGLGRGSRLQQSRDFARLRREGQRAVCGCLIANWQRASIGNARVGVVVSSKVGGAVIRSRVRRLLRETFRLHQHELARPVDLVLVARPSIAGCALAEVEKDFLTTMKRAGLINREADLSE